ncbi:alpha-E domain-containing protein [Actomonas aquatica]|uniref:Alpha-E domain-containing protein n=1 Tax=Actomonas aquatica TaxID=2866162 RepID=A0ABZ1C4N2_9BACT|nr:alpha-E domain-containing protein [Opitutus sp. WL0086]WRQ86590.1 alpha-E domain-containing protein [Opitutus sp. WL0086]
MPTSPLILDDAESAARSGMLSRVASLIYWTARQLERAENTVRLVDVNAQLVLDLEARRDADDPRAWEPLVFVTGDDEGFHKIHGDNISEETVVRYLLFDRENPSSYVSCIAAARENARCIQDQIASEMWETLNTFYHELSTHSFRTYQKQGSSDYLAQLKLRIQQLYGVAESMLPRDEGWWFYLLGRYLERADNVSRIIDIKYFMILPDLHEVGSALDIVQWASVLRSCSGFEAFRRSKRGQLNLERAVDYLLYDRAFPRSILASIISAENCLNKIAAAHGDAEQNPVLAKINQTRVHLENSDVTSVISNGLHEYLDAFQIRLGEIHAAVQDNFFDYDV